MINHKSGIYKIINILTLDIYIGSSIKFSDRKNLHFNNLKLNKHHSIILQRAYNKYGFENFIFEIIEYIEDKSKLIEREQFYLDILKPKYNICKIAGSLLGIKKTEADKQGISLRKRLRDKIHGGTRIGMTNSENHRKNISLGKINKSQLKHRKPILQININTNEIIKEWDCIKDAHIGLGKKFTGVISRTCNGKLNHAYGFNWKYKNIVK